jgi:hypothetical protein
MNLIGNKQQGAVAQKTYPISGTAIYLKLLFSESQSEMGPLA